VKTGAIALNEMNSNLVAAYSPLQIVV